MIQKLHFACFFYLSCSLCFIRGDKISKADLCRRVLGGVIAFIDDQRQYIDDVHSQVHTAILFGPQPAADNEKTLHSNVFHASNWIDALKILHDRVRFPLIDLVAEPSSSHFETCSRLLSEKGGVRLRSSSSRIVSEVELGKTFHIVFDFHFSE